MAQPMATGTLAAIRAVFPPPPELEVPPPPGFDNNGNWVGPPQLPMVVPGLSPPPPPAPVLPPLRAVAPPPGPRPTAEDSSSSTATSAPAGFVPRGMWSTSYRRRLERMEQERLVRENALSAQRDPIDWDVLELEAAEEEEEERQRRERE